jgi:hypothetical protein
MRLLIATINALLKPLIFIKLEQYQFSEDDSTDYLSPNLQIL